MKITREDLDQVRSIVTHADCGDGLASAMVLDSALLLGKSAIKFLHYGSKEHRELPATRGMLFCDFSPPKDRIQEFVDTGAIVLDHHERALVEPFGDRGVFGENDKLESGAALAFKVWELVGKKTEVGRQEWPRTKRDMVGRFAHLCAVRDTWQKDHPDFAAACDIHSALKYLPRDAFLESSIEFAQVGHWLDLGKYLRRDHLARVKRAVDSGHSFVEHGLRFLCFEGVDLTSDASEFAETDIVIGWMYKVDAGEKRLVLSCRSRCAVDVAPFAKSHGGGGHPKAAGCTIAVEGRDMNPWVYIEWLVGGFDFQRGAPR